MPQGSALDRSGGSSGEYSLIDRFLGYAFGVLSCQFWGTVHVLQCGARLQIHLKLLDCVVSGDRFLTGSVFECDIAHRRSVTVCISSGIRSPSLWCSTSAVYASEGYAGTHKAKFGNAKVGQGRGNW